MRQIDNSDCANEVFALLALKLLALRDRAAKRRSVRSQTGFSFFDESPWRYFRLVSETSGRTIYTKGPIRMSDNEARHEEAAMLGVTIDRQILARPERYDWTGTYWRRA